MSIRDLTPDSTLDGLRRQAKRWKRQIDQGDAQALARLDALSAKGGHGLRQVQHALAREHGFRNWAELKQELEDRARSRAETVSLFLEKGANRYGVDPRTGKWGRYELDSARRGEVAARLLARDPSLARENIHTAVLAHDIDAVRHFLARSTGSANQRSEFDRWTPLARLAYARLPLAATAGDPLEIARLLLAAGADPAASWTGDPSDATALTGVIGGGEGGQTPHPQAWDLAQLLIAHGADPLDGQALYNTSLGDDDTTWLERLWSLSDQRGEASRWRQPVPQLPGPPLDYLLGNAVPRHPERVAWLLAHGADANAANAYSKQPVLKHALVVGATAVAEMLVAHGARPVALDRLETFCAVVAQGDAAAVRDQAAQAPGLLADPSPLFAAIHAGSAEMARLLLDLGMSPDIADRRNYRALHLAAASGQKEIAELLIARGAEIDPVEVQYLSVPLGQANFHRRSELVDLLAPLSHDIRALCFSGATTRIAELLAADPGLASRPSRGEPLLFALPDDDARSMEVAELLLSFGADPSARNREGRTPAEVARSRGLEEAALLLEP